jgi:predicted N-acyltransferase
MKPRHGLHLLGTLGSVDAEDWDALAEGNPFVSHAFLNALHESGCASKRTGWTPCFPTIWESGQLVGAMPLYLKAHSYGEYVFDWAWADAYQRHGLDYYPKLLSAVPFTPVTGPRLLVARADLRANLMEAALGVARESSASSFHCLFPADAAPFQDAGLLVRHSVQFHWQNAGYRDFEEFTGRMNHEKRKKIRQERRKVREAGLSFHWLTGETASEADWEFFIGCYNRTYQQHHSSPYLNLEFFLRLARSMPRQLLLILGSRDGRPVSAALNVMNDHAMFGRYWGAQEFHPGLHFETCYYQSIEYCIQHGLRFFEGGAQGEHKLSRGLTPVTTQSVHWLAHPEFSDAIARFLARETEGVERYVDELNEHSPFKVP